MLPLSHNDRSLSEDSTQLSAAFQMAVKLGLGSPDACKRLLSIVQDNQQQHSNRDSSNSSVSTAAAGQEEQQCGVLRAAALFLQQSAHQLSASRLLLRLLECYREDVDSADMRHQESQHASDASPALSGWVEWVASLLLRTLPSSSLPCTLSGVAIEVIAAAMHEQCVLQALALSLQMMEPAAVARVLGVEAAIGLVECVVCSSVCTLFTGAYTGTSERIQIGSGCLPAHIALI